MENFKGRKNRSVRWRRQISDVRGTCPVHRSILQLNTCVFSLQNPHFGADPSPGRDAAPHLHYALTQLAFPVVRVHLQTPARLLQFSHRP